MSIAAVWTPRISEELVAKHENHNAFDRYAIVAPKSLPSTIRPSLVGTSTRKNFKFCTIFDYPPRVSIVQRHERLQVIKKYEELVNKHY